MKTSTQNAWAIAALMMGATFVASCKKDDTPALPAIGGFNSSNEVASNNLKAHFPFDGSNNERISGTAPTSAINAAFVMGASGQRQALNLTSGYVYYPEIAALNQANALPSFTISAWVNVKNNRLPTGDNPSMIFTMPRADDWIGNVNILAETGRYSAANDTLVVKGLLSQRTATGDASNQDSVNEPSKKGDQAFKGAGKWSHLVITYDGATSMFVVYANGKKISNPEWEQRGTTGPLNLRTPSRVLIGGFGTNLPGRTADNWQKAMVGQIDEVRVYNKALPIGDINALYQLEAAGR